MRKPSVYIFVSVILVSGIFGLIAFDQSKDEAKKNSEVFMALGDSLTYGVGDKSGAGYVGDLQKLLEENHKGKITVDNYGIPGQQSDGLLHQLGKPGVLENLEKADYITVFIGMNDLVKSNGMTLDKIHDEKVKRSKVDYERNLSKIFNIIRKKNPDAPVLFLGLYNPKPSSAEVEQVIQDWNDTSRQITSKYSHVKFISTNDLFEVKSTKYFSDALHPNKIGYQLITKEIVKEYDF